MKIARKSPELLILLMTIGSGISWAVWLNLLNNFAIEVFGKDLIILEDLWFWGYFNSKTKKLSKTQSKKNIEFNSSKYNTDLYMYPGVICKTSKFDEFRELLYEKK